MALPNFIVAGSLNEILGDVASDELVETAATRAVLVFESNHPSELPLLWEGGIKRLEQPRFGYIDTEGNLVSEDGSPLRLLARHEELVPNLQWKVTPRFPAQGLPPIPNRLMRSWWIDAGYDSETVNIATTAVVANVNGTAVTRGPRTYAAPLDVGNPDSLWQWHDELGVAVGDPVAFPDTFAMDSIDGGTP